MKTCSVEGCERKHSAGGLCHRHYLPVWRAKNPEKCAEYAAHDLAWKHVNKDRIYAQTKERRATMSVDERRDLGYRRRFGVTYAFVLDLLAQQEDMCAMCTCPLLGMGKGEGLGVLDHCHTTGEIRGVLCGPCNVSLGHYEKVKPLAEAYLTKAVPPSTP